MFLRPEDVQFLLLNGVWLLSLGICLLLLILPAYRRRTNPLALLVWANLAAGTVWYGQFALAAAQEARFHAGNPGYAAAALPFDGRSVYIATPRDMRQAAYSCYGSYSTTLCEMPVAQMLKSGRLDFVEMGRDPIHRYALTVHDPRCLDWDRDTAESPLEADFALQDRFVSPGMGACVIRTEVARVTATHEITTNRTPYAFPSRKTYWAVQLRNRADGTVIDRFDGWNRAGPYLSFDPPTERRRPTTGPLADLVMLRPDVNTYDRSVDDRLLAEHGIDEDLLRTAARASYQMVRARAIWLACRDHVVAALSEETRRTLTDASVDLFPNNPDWRYPRDCRPEMR